EKLAQAGVVTLKHAGRSVMVELNESFDENALKAAAGDGATLAAPPDGTGDAGQPPSADGFGGSRPPASDGLGPRPVHSDASRPPHEIRPAPMDMPAQV